MSKSITQDMAYRQSLMKYAEKYGVSRASRKYNRAGHISTSGRLVGMEPWDLCPVSPGDLTDTPISTQMQN